jgi:hypothetical protein
VFFLSFVLFLSGIRASLVNCSPVPTTKPWRGYKECETIWNAWPKDCPAGEQPEAVTIQ